MKKPGQVAYDVYCQEIGGRCRAYEDLTARERAAWCAVEQAVLQADIEALIDSSVADGVEPPHQEGR